MVMDISASQPTTDKPISFLQIYVPRQLLSPVFMDLTIEPWLRHIDVCSQVRRHRKKDTLGTRQRGKERNSFHSIFTQLKIIFEVRSVRRHMRA